MTEIQRINSIKKVNSQKVLLKLMVSKVCALNNRDVKGAHFSLVWSTVKHIDRRHTNLSHVIFRHKRPTKEDWKGRSCRLIGTVATCKVCKASEK